jgi:hypothetical protein
VPGCRRLGKSRPWGRWPRFHPGHDSLSPCHQSCTCAEGTRITDEDAAHIAERKTLETGFHPPLDIVDGAARIVDPIFDGINTGRHVWGQFLKDYRPTAW